jgi:hypothetical protein
LGSSLNALFGGFSPSALNGNTNEVRRALSYVATTMRVVMTLLMKGTTS